MLASRTSRRGSQIDGVVALVTGTDCGFGAALVRALLARGATRVYGATPDAGSAEQRRFVPVQLDAARPGQLKALASELGDVGLLVNHVALVEHGRANRPSRSNHPIGR
jgi:NAD(P)-dependent dehydrogenase (short-subunit alcohol dehydrogenase family)